MQIKNMLERLKTETKEITEIYVKEVTFAYDDETKKNKEVGNLELPLDTDVYQGETPYDRIENAVRRLESRFVNPAKRDNTITKLYIYIKADGLTYCIDFVDSKWLLYRLQIFKKNPNKPTVDKNLF